MKRAVAAICGALLVAGCTGVPSSSAPQAIEALNTGAPSESAPPYLDSDARTMATAFLAANTTTTGRHSAARQYLTPNASNRWSDRTATIIANDYSVSTYDKTKQTVTVYGRVLGRLDSQGIYTPSLQGNGDGGHVTVPFVFTFVQSGSRFRISGLQNGLLLTEQQFRDTYRQHLLYFWDLTGDALVPDLRWSAIADGRPLGEWLITQLINGPRPELQNAVSADTTPAQADTGHIAVTLGTPTRIEIPGSGQLDSSVRYRLAAQLSQLLVDVVAGGDMTITDGGRPITIPALNSNEFNSSDFFAAIGPSVVEPALYYLNGGRLRDEAGRAVSGCTPDGGGFLTSFALSRRQSGSPLLCAGVVGSGSSARLYMGTQSGGLRPTSLVGALTRPSFAPGRGEAWIGAGSRVYRVTTSGSTVRTDDVPIPAVSGGGQVLAVRLSPEGVRIAIVVSGAAGAAQLYVGSIVRGAGQVHLDGLEPISPGGVAVRDVAWLDSSKLFAIGYLVGSQDAKTFETGVDGTEWTNAKLGNLPSPPDSVTAATGSTVWVSASDYVWKQSGSDWVSPGPNGLTSGTAPVYLE